MTIYLSHSAAFAYDLLAIAAIKARRNPDDNEAKGNLMLLDDEIQRQVGTLHHEQVCASAEYRALLVCHQDNEPTGDLLSVLQNRWFTAPFSRL